MGTQEVCNEQLDNQKKQKFITTDYTKAQVIHNLTRKYKLDSANDSFDPTKTPLG